MRNFLINYFRYRDSNQIMIYVDCNRIESFFLLRVTLKYVYRSFKVTVCHLQKLVGVLYCIELASLYLFNAVYG